MVSELKLLSLNIESLTPLIHPPKNFDAAIDNTSKKEILNFFDVLILARQKSLTW